MSGNNMHTHGTLNDRAYNMLSSCFLMNNFLESFLLIFGQNKYINQEDIEHFFSQNRFVSKK